jgi:hypothetical protein
MSEARRRIPFHSPTAWGHDPIRSHPWNCHRHGDPVSAIESGNSWLWSTGNPLLLLFIPRKRRHVEGLDFHLFWIDDHSARYLIPRFLFHSSSRSGLFPLFGLRAKACCENGTTLDGYQIALLSHMLQRSILGCNSRSSEGMDDDSNKIIHRITEPRVNTNSSVTLTIKMPVIPSYRKACSIVVSVAFIRHHQASLRKCVRFWEMSIT